jgi:predicted metal-dependent peptidase
VGGSILGQAKKYGVPELKSSQKGFILLALALEKESNLGRAKKKQAKEKETKAVWDDHTRWGMDEEDETLRDVWVKRFEDACEAISIREPSNLRGLLPLFAKRLLKELKNSQTDWRTILNDFVQEEIVDYSFTPPDRRFDESPFFLPDFNDKDDLVEDILFMIDTSGSMSDDMITAAYSEVKGAIDQFDGKLKGWLGFFDAAVIEPKPFANEDEFRIIKPAGGGGTDFQIIFEYVQKHMQDKLPASIIILTDGYAPFPKKRIAGGVPVLWLLNNDQVVPPWGKVARITV